MTALIIIGIIVLIIVFLVMCSIRAELKFYGGKLDFKVKYLFFTIYPFKEKTEKKKKKTDRSEQRVKNIEVESDVKKQKIMPAIQLMKFQMIFCWANQIKRSKRSIT